MRATLDAPYRDTRADALSFALGLEPLDALAVLPVRRGGIDVEMRLLGASHQVFAGPVSETVACLPGRAGPLPGRMRTQVDGWAYDFGAQVHTHGTDAAFTAAVRHLCAALADRDDALVGTFPGSPHAVTALALDGDPHAGTLGWRTWHAYPQTRQIVVTRTLLEVAL
ncbi:MULTISPECIES: DUF2617 family protein [Thermomonospora]|uniref:DUF2617 domain-containing protein n=1 Tax=Thermomonospora curvata (strain ATCC 19995 / DSM 43183 / JCM 3096 / KCTC 9072 / NBRC 15933 / NCIMB 10081 / Henssen B9) TaxID=471852 RepID=D1A8P2_THECD|nr:MULTISPECIES: DUF2617 family protein [Thermomonospora]ACY96737.1 conserved hypothetical protein [Thermomonospora curvata DSM 43183]PKK15282.1 MAG: DUF2617 domain-containing protein [Thermomonospora sp. CIF 1]